MSALIAILELYIKNLFLKLCPRLSDQIRSKLIWIPDYWIK